MQIINMSKTKLNSLEPLILPKNVTSTECELFKYPYYGKEKLLKKLHRTDGIIFANKLYTIENGRRIFEKKKVLYTSQYRIKKCSKEYKVYYDGEYIVNLIWGV